MWFTLLPQAKYTHPVPKGDDPNVPRVMVSSSSPGSLGDLCQSPHQVWMQIKDLHTPQTQHLTYTQTTKHSLQHSHSEGEEMTNIWQLGGHSNSKIPLGIHWKAIHSVVDPDSLGDAPQSSLSMALRSTLGHYSFSIAFLGCIQWPGSFLSLFPT